MRLWKARNEWANARTRNFTKSRVTQGGSLLKVLRLSQAVCSALLFKVRSLLWLDVVVFAPTLKNRSHYWVRLKRTSTAIRPGREANEMGSFPRQRWWGRRMPSDITIAGPVCHVEVIWIHEEVLDFITSSRSLMRIHWGIGALSTNSRLVVLSKFYITVCMYQCMILRSNQLVCYENTLIVNILHFWRYEDFLQTINWFNLVLHDKVCAMSAACRSRGTSQKVTIVCSQWPPRSDDFCTPSRRGLLRT